jgi:hypothetical protein
MIRGPWIIGPHQGDGPTRLCPDKALLDHLRVRNKTTRVCVAPCPVAGKPEDVPHEGDIIDIRERYPAGYYGPVLFRMRVEAREDIEWHDGAELTLKRVATRSDR